MPEIEATLVLSLRRALYQTITAVAEQLANLIEGRGAWMPEWARVLCVTLEDYVAMPELLLTGKVDEYDPAYWGYRHRRWHHLSDVCFNCVSQARYQFQLPLVALTEHSRGLIEKTLKVTAHILKQ